MQAAPTENPTTTPFRPTSTAKGRFPLDLLLQLRRDPLALFEQLKREHGDVVRFRIARAGVWLVSDPELIKDVFTTHNASFVKGRGLERAKVLLGQGLLTSERDFHLRQRRMAQPAFHRQRIAGYAEVMVDEAERTDALWTAGSGSVDMMHEMMRLTLAIVAKTLFGANVDAETVEIEEALSKIMPIFADVSLPFADLLQKLPLPRYRRFRAACRRLDETVYRMIERGRKSGGPGDLLSMLLSARDSEGDGTGMNDVQVRDEVMTLFLAGHETTANALSWTFYLLGQNPDVERALHEELAQVLGTRRASAADFGALPYTTAVVSEAMRLYPPAWIISRKAVEPVLLGGHLIPAQDIVVVSPWVMHRDARYFAEPLQFNPGHFLGDAKAGRPKYAYFPFGGGTRQCIGEGFAWMESVLVLATLARKWRARVTPGHPIATQPLITLRPRYGVGMTLERRMDA